MADDPGAKRPEPASDAKKHASKLVVLSNVAKEPTPPEDSLLGEADPTKTPPPGTKPPEGLIRPVGWTTRPGGTTTIIKLPPKTGVLPRMTSLARKTDSPEEGAASSTPSNGGELKKHTSLIKLAPPTAAPPSPQESIFPSAASPPLEVRKPAPSSTPPPPLPPRGDRSTFTPASTVEPKRKTMRLAPLNIIAPAEPETARVPHVPPLVPADAPTREAELETKKPEVAAKPDAVARTTKLIPPAAEAFLVPPEPVVAKQPPAPAPPAPDRPASKHRLPPRAQPTGRLTKPGEAPAAEKTVASPNIPISIPPKVFPAVAPAAAASTPPATPAAPSSVTPRRATVTPPTIPLRPGAGTVKPPTIPLKPAPSFATARPEPLGVAAPVIAAEDQGLTPAAGSRAARKRKRELVGTIVFYVLLAALLPVLYFGALYMTQETRVEGQVIPPTGMQVANEVWIVTDFRDMAGGIASDLADNRQIILQDMQEKLGHVQRAQADVSTREARIRLLKDRIQADDDEEMSLVKQARDAAQQVWDGPGASLEADYHARLDGLNRAIAERAKANRLDYEPDPNFYSPEVWANAYRLALYQTPAGVDSVKERAWLGEQMKAWHDFTKKMDQQQNDLRDEATKLKLAPASKVADLKSQVEDLQQRMDSTAAEEEPLKAELEQAQNDLKAVQTKEAALDAKPYAQLDALPEQNITKRLPLSREGRFSWRELEKESKFGAEERSHVFWIFARAYRLDGRQFWSLHRFEVDKNSTTQLMIEPNSFASTRTILRPDLSPDEQAR